MPAVAGAQGVRGAASSGGGAAPAGAPGSPSLLPRPSNGILGALDPIAALYAIESEQQSLGVQDGTRRVGALQTERKQALDDEKKAMAAEAAAAQHHDFWDDVGGFFGDVAKFAGLVAAAAATVCSCGAATPLLAVAIVGTVLSTATFVDGEFHVLERLGVDAKTAGWVDLAMGVAGAACSVVGVVGSAGAVSGAASASHPGEASASLKSVAGVVDRAAEAVSGVAMIGTGASTIAASDARADVDRAGADEVVAESLSARALRFIQNAIDEIQNSDQQSEQTKNILTSTEAILEQTATATAGAMRG